MVFFTTIKPTKHYLEHHAHHVPWHEVIAIILATKNPRKKEDAYEIETKEHYLLFHIKEQTLFVINAKRKQP